MAVGNGYGAVFLVMMLLVLIYEGYDGMTALMYSGYNSMMICDGENGGGNENCVGMVVGSGYGTVFLVMMSLIVMI